MPAVLAAVIVGTIVALVYLAVNRPDERHGWADTCAFAGCDETPAEKFYDVEGERFVDLCALHADLVRYGHHLS